MNRLTMVALVLFLAAVSVLPVQAAANQPVVLITAPSPLYQGEDGVVNLLVMNTSSRTVTFQGKVLLPKSVVSSVTVVGSGIEPFADKKGVYADYWVYKWSAKVQPGKWAAVDLVVAIQPEIVGEYELVKVIDSRGRELAVAQVEVLKAELTMSISSPDLVLAGGYEFQAVFSIDNKTPKALAYDYKIYNPFQGATDRSVNIQLFGGELYWMEGDRNGLALFWKGVVQPGENHQLILSFKSGFAGYYKYLILTDLLNNVQTEVFITIN